MKMCGNNEVHIPDCDETCCEMLTRRVNELDEKKLEQFDIQAGTNIDIERVEDERTVIISSPNVYNKNEVDAIISAMETGAYEEVDELPTVGDPRKIYLVPNQGGGYERYIYSNGVWKDLGSTDITLDKTTILTALGYRETTITFVDVNNVETTKKILVENTI